MSESNLHVLAANNTALAGALTELNDMLSPLARLLGPFGLGHMNAVVANLKVAIEQAHANAEMALNLIGDRPPAPAIAPAANPSQLRNLGFEGELAAEKQAQAGRIAAARANLGR